MKNFTLAEIRRSIPYVPALRPYLGTVTACILMQQLEFWFATKVGKPFYKFLDKQKSKNPHPAYKSGDSWCEELGISQDEFRCGYDKIGIRYTSYTEFKQAATKGNAFQGRYYASYHNKIEGLTWYLRNHDLVDALQSSIFTRNSGNPIYVNGISQSTYMDKDHSRKLGKPIPNITEITTKITAEKTTTELNKPVAVSTVTLENHSFSALLNLIPEDEHSPRLCKALKAAIAVHGEEFSRSNIDYCLVKHKSKDGENSLGGMIVDSLSEDYAKASREKTAKRAASRVRNEEDRRRQDEQEMLRIETKTKDALEWNESEEGRAFTKRFLNDDS